MPACPPVQRRTSQEALNQSPCVFEALEAHKVCTLSWRDRNPSRMPCNHLGGSSPGRTPNSPGDLRGGRRLYRSNFSTCPLWNFGYAESSPEEIEYHYQHTCPSPLHIPNYVSAADRCWSYFRGTGSHPRTVLWYYSPINPQLMRRYRKFGSNELNPGFSYLFELYKYIFTTESPKIDHDGAD